MDWFLQVFSEPRQQAQLVAIVVSACIAILVLLLNQWFINRKSRKDLHIQKIESLYESINQYESESMRLISQLFHKVDNAECLETLFKARSHFQTIEMYLNLHFSGASLDINPHQEFFTLINEELANRKERESYLPDTGFDTSKGFYLSSQRKALLKVNENTELLKDLAKKQMKSYK